MFANVGDTGNISEMSVYCSSSVRTSACCAADNSGLILTSLTVSFCSEISVSNSALGLSGFPPSPTERLESSVPHSHSQLVLMALVYPSKLPKARLVLVHLQDLQNQQESILSAHWRRRFSACVQLDVVIRSFHSFQDLERTLQLHKQLVVTGGQKNKHQVCT